MGWCAVVVLWVVLWVEASGWCYELRPMGCAMGGAVDDAVGCALVVLWVCGGFVWVCGGLGDENKKE